MKDKISQLIDRRKALGEMIEKLLELNEPDSSPLVVELKRRWIVLDKKIANLWE